MGAGSAADETAAMQIEQRAAPPGILRHQPFAMQTGGLPGGIARFFRPHAARQAGARQHLHQAAQQRHIIGAVLARLDQAAQGAGNQAGLQAGAGIGHHDTLNMA